MHGTAPARGAANLAAGATALPPGGAQGADASRRYSPGRILEADGRERAAEISTNAGFRALY